MHTMDHNGNCIQPVMWRSRHALPEWHVNGIEQSVFSVEEQLFYEPGVNICQYKKLPAPEHSHHKPRTQSNFCYAAEMHNGRVLELVLYRMRLCPLQSGLTPSLYAGFLQSPLPIGPGCMSPR